MAPVNATADALMSVFGMKRVKPKKCRACKAEYQPRSTTQTACGPVCAYQLSIAKREDKAAADMKAERKAIKERREAIKSRSQWAREAQAAVNAFVRERDKDLPCISCGRFHQGSYDAGHYRSVGAMPALRFDLANIHKQCVPCNQHKAGNILEYRIGLVARIGAQEVARLEANHAPKKYDIAELKAIKADYRAKLKALRASL